MALYVLAKTGECALPHFQKIVQLIEDEDEAGPGVKRLAVNVMRDTIAALGAVPRVDVAAKNVAPKLARMVVDSRTSRDARVLAAAVLASMSLWFVDGGFQVMGEENAKLHTPWIDRLLDEFRDVHGGVYHGPDVSDDFDDDDDDDTDTEYPSSEYDSDEMF